MANELQITVAVKYQKGNSRTLDETYGPKKVTVSGNPAILGAIVSVGTSEEVIPLAEVTAAGALMFGKNLDDTNYIEIRDATGAANDVVKVGPGEPFCFRFGSDVTAPYWIANTAACLVEYTLISA